MAFEGYFEYAGVEVVNVARTEAYAAHMPTFKALYNNDLLPQVLDRQFTYLSPAQDLAPWYDPDVPESNDFYGAYPLSVSGIENSSRSSTVIEFTVDGGVPGRLRHGTKSVVFQVVLVGASEAAVEYGMTWLRRALLGPVCAEDTLSTKQALGADLLYLSAEPRYEEETSGVWQKPGSGSGLFRPDPNDPTILLVDPDASGSDYVGRQDADTLLVGPSEESYSDPYSPDVLVINDPQTGNPVVGAFDSPRITYLRYVKRLRRFAVNNGPNVTTQNRLSCGGAAWVVQFTGVAGSPYQFSADRPIIQAYGATSSPWVPGVEAGTATPAGSPSTFTDPVCDSGTYTPLYDPLCPALIGPPSVPNVMAGCWVAPSQWQRRIITIPSSNVPIWGDSAPIITLYSQAGARGVRIRFYDDPDGNYSPNDDPCSYTGDLVATYIPPGGTMTIDTAFQEVFVETTLGRARRADSLVVSTDGTPPKWPTLSCGYGYVLTIDTVGSTMPTVDVSLTARSL